MKSMKDRKMDMRSGGPRSEGFFPEAPEHRALPKVGEIDMFKYPDTEQEVHRDQEQFVREAKRAKAKPDFRH